MSTSLALSSSLVPKDLLNLNKSTESNNHNHNFKLYYYFKSPGKYENVLGYKFSTEPEGLTGD